MKSKQKISCDCCGKGDLDTKLRPSGLQPGRKFNYCPICYSMMAEPTDIVENQDKTEDILLIIYSSSEDRYYELNYKVPKFLEIITDDNHKFGYRDDAVKFIKNAGIYKKRKISYQEIDRFVIALKKDHKTFLGCQPEIMLMTEKFEEALHFELAEDANKYIQSIEEIAENDWTVIPSKTQLLMETVNGR